MVWLIVWMTCCSTCGTCSAKCADWPGVICPWLPFGNLLPRTSSWKEMLPPFFWIHLVHSYLVISVCCSCQGSCERVSMQMLSYASISICMFKHSLSLFFKHIFAYKYVVYCHALGQSTFWEIVWSTLRITLPDSSPNGAWVPCIEVRVALSSMPRLGHDEAKGLAGQAGKPNWPNRGWARLHLNAVNGLCWKTLRVSDQNMFQHEVRLIGVIFQGLCS